MTDEEVAEERYLRLRVMRADLRLKNQQYDLEPYKLLFLGGGAGAAVVGALVAIYKAFNP